MSVDMSAPPTTAASGGLAGIFNANGKRPLESSTTPSPGPMASKKQNTSKQSMQKLFEHHEETFRHDRELPMNLILMVTSWLDDVGDIARICRTSRLLYYMTIPRLWEHVTLRSHTEIRYRNGWPEGFGGASPFATALDHIASQGNVGTYIKSLRLVGTWKERDTDDFAKGRVPDGSMMLNIVVRSAIERCVNLQSFAWELNTKPVRNVYSAFTNCKTLTHLTLKMPSTRTPRPIVLIPGVPGLKSLRVFNYDPLCYPDDIGALIGCAHGLESLKIHFSPRMRQERELSVNLQSFFARCVIERNPLPLKEMALVNLYAKVTINAAYTIKTLEKVTFLNCASLDDPTTHFVDSSWKTTSSVWDTMPMLKSLRADMVDPIGVSFLGHLKGLEEFYIVNSRTQPQGIQSPATTPATTGASPASPIVPGTTTNSATNSAPSPPVSYPTPSNFNVVNLASDYMAALLQNHGPTLRKLVFSERWSLTPAVFKNLCESCPRLEQVAVALDAPPFEQLRMALRTLPRLYAFKVLQPMEEKLISDRMVHSDGEQVTLLSKEFWKEDYKNLRYFGLGGLAYELGLYDVDDDGNKRRNVRVVPWDEIKSKVAIFGQDSLEI